MARIMFGSYMVRYPLGGVLSSSLQWLVGLKQLGHDVYLVEKSGWANACFDPSRDVMTDDCAYGLQVLDALLRRFDLGDRWCYVDAQQEYHGMSRRSVEDAFAAADVFIDWGTHGAWLGEAQKTRMRVLIDGEPGRTQIKMQTRLAEGQALPDYDYYFTVGRNIGTPDCSIPTAGKEWRALFHPVVVGLFSSGSPPSDAPFTTVMNWQAHKPVEYGGRIYGQKDVELAEFMTLPARTDTPLELAVAGKAAPRDQLIRAGWRIREAHRVTASFDSYVAYIHASRGEFSVAKNIFVATRSGWFSDRSAVYLASGRPVVMQDTGFSAHLPCGQGLFAVRSVAEAAAAIEAIVSDHAHHSKAAREIAAEYLDSTKVLASLLRALGL